MCLRAVVPVLFVAIASGVIIGRCDLDTPPSSWLATSAIGITAYGQSGANPNTSEYCLVYDQSNQYVQVAYHIDLPSNHLNRKNSEFHAILDRSPNNFCASNDTRIQYCYPFCSQSFEDTAVSSALLSSLPWVVANKISNSITNSSQWAITVLSVDYNNPNTHLNISSFPDFNVWCSVYIGINPTVGFPYLYEIQLGKIIE